MNGIAPIKEPSKLHIAQMLFTINISKINKSNMTFAENVIGNNIQFAAIKKIKIQTLELNEGETSLIVNGKTDNIRVPMDTSNLITETDGAIFDEEKKAQAVAKVINLTNKEKIKSIREEIANAESFLSELIEKGA